jgi:hypothetical protein
MLNRFRLTVIVFLGALFVLASAGGAQGRPEVRGTWHSLSIERTVGGNYMRRLFTFSGEEWEVIYTVYADPDRSVPLYTMRAGGPYVMLGPSKDRPGAQSANFGFSYRLLTLRTSDTEAIGSLGFDACNLEHVVTKDITATGCSFFQPVKDCPWEYDILWQEGKSLRLGRRTSPNGMCSENRRPGKLGYPLSKRRF